MTKEIVLVLGTAGSDWEKAIGNVLDAWGGNADNAYIFDPTAKDVGDGMRGIQTMPLKMGSDIEEILSGDEELRYVIVNAVHLCEGMSLQHIVQNSPTSFLLTGRLFDVSGRPFSVTASLMPYALTIYTSVECAEATCRSPAAFSQILVMGAPVYNFTKFLQASGLGREEKPVCFDHFVKPGEQKRFIYK